MIGFVRALALVAVAMAGSAKADEYPVVIELFTSQGCSSCPPADKLLTQLSDREDVIALALHVDYWDYIGWKDAFALPGHTVRQKQYAAVAGKRMVYTPQMVVGGTDHLVGLQPMQMIDAVERNRAMQGAVTLNIFRSGDILRVQAQAHEAPRGPVNVQLVRFLDSQTVNITRGENRGRTITYSNIVTSWERIGTWDGATPLEIEMPVTGPEALAVIVQDDGPGPILAAKQLR